MYNAVSVRAALIALVIAAAVLFPSHTQAAPGTLLRYHWVVGARIRQSEIDTAVNTTSISGMGSSTLVWRYDTTETVLEVYGDGSGLVRFTFTDVHKTNRLQHASSTTYALTGYAVKLRLSPTGTIVHRAVVGTLPQGVAFPSSIAQPIPTIYPMTPVVVGSTWPQTYFGIEHAQYQVRALGTSQGKPTATLTMTIHQTVSIPNVAASVTFSGKATETIEPTTGTLLTPFHGAFTEIDTFWSDAKKQKLEGTLTTVTTQDGKNLP